MARLLTATALLIGSLSGCSDARSARTGEEPAAATGATDGRPILQGAGLTFVHPIMLKWVAEYEKRTGARVVYRSVGSSEGVRRILEKTVDFGASDVALTDEEIARAPAPIVHVPVALGAVVVAYNRQGLPSSLRLSKDAIASIFLGEIKKWNDAKIAASNPDVRLPDLDIAVTVRSDGSGTTGVFTRYLADGSPRWSREVGSAKSVKFPVGKAAAGNEGVARELARAPGAIGYVELAYAKQADLGLGYAFAENPAGKFVEPTIETATAAAERAVRDLPEDLRVSLVDVREEDAYPLTSFTFALVYESTADEAKGRSLAQFLWWVVHEGQKLGPSLSYAPLPAQIMPRLERRLRALKAADHLALD